MPGTDELLVIRSDAEGSPAALQLPAFVGRFQHLQIGGVSHTAAWCLRSHGVMDTHQPEQFALLTCR